jgi:hypothetical protein
MTLFEIDTASKQLTPVAETLLGLTAHTEYESPKKDAAIRQTLFDKSLTGALGVPIRNETP